MATLAPSFLSDLLIDRVRISASAKLAALERVEKSQKTDIGRYVVATLEPSVLIGSSSLLQVMRACINA